MDQQSLLTRLMLITGVSLLILTVFFISGAAGFLAIVVADLVETFPRLGFLSRLILYYVVVLPTSWFLALGITHIVPRRPRWLTYSFFAFSILGGTYLLFFRWRLP